MTREEAIKMLEIISADARKNHKSYFVEKIKEIIDFIKKG